MTQESNSTETCCPEFNPELWDNKQFEWDSKLFIKDKVATFFYMPLNFGSVMRRLDKSVHEANAEVPEWLCLSEHTSKWNMNLYMAVSKSIPSATMTSLSGKFYSRVYEGSFSETGKWLKEFAQSANNLSIKTSKEYMWYTTCPKCAKKYGKNYVVIIAQIEVV